MRQRPNILLITSDQYRFPRFSYGPEGGFAEALKNILGFQGEVGDDSPYARYFPGLLRLRRNAVVLRNHTIAASACTPSRATLYTGQYGTRTGVTQTDGLFKSGDAANFPWLKADSFPTLGAWMRGAGYTSHYFGKWHVSNPADHSLNRYGFDNWEQSYPEPHGKLPNNLGLYRDIGFADQACTFLNRQGLALNYDYLQGQISAEHAEANPTGSHLPPWFAVVSFTNPHDIAAYPAVPARALPPPATSADSDQNGSGRQPATQSAFGPLTVPQQGQKSLAPTAGTMAVPLNPLGFPQDCASLPPTALEDLSSKPACQKDYAYKIGLALSAKTGFNVVSGIAGKLGRDGLTPEKLEAAVAVTLKSTVPFALAADPLAVARDFIQFYAYLHTVLDRQIDRVLQALDDSGQADNTIVIFLTDHGEYGAAHGLMMEKWHTAYQEALHVPVVVQFPPGLHQVDGNLKQIDAVTSHIDILPTILGLAGVEHDERQAIAAKLSAHHRIAPLPGTDLAPLIKGLTDEVIEADGQPRQGVLFITDDEITVPLPPIGDPQETDSLLEFAVYNAAVEAVISGRDGKGPLPDLHPGPVRQPNNIRCVRTADFKLARYFDPAGHHPQQWELYDLIHDPHEAVNLVDLDLSPPQVRSALPPWISPATAQAAADRLTVLLADLEARDL